MIWPVDAARRAQAQELRREGLSIREIELAMPGKSSSSIRRWVREVVLSPHQEELLETRWIGARLKPRVDPRHGPARQLRAEGESIKAIARRLQASPSAISRWVEGVVLTPSQERAIEARRVVRERATREARVAEEGRPATMHALRAKPPAPLPAHIRADIARALLDEYLSERAALGIVRAVVTCDLVLAALYEEERCTKLVRVARAGGWAPPELLDEPPIDRALAREITRLVYEASRQTDLSRAGPMAVRAIGLLRDSGLTLVQRAYARYCGRIREAVRRRRARRDPRRRRG